MKRNKQINSPQIEVQFSQYGFWRHIKIISKLTWKNERARKAKTILKNKSKVEGINLLDFTTYTAQQSRLCGIGREIDTKINGIGEKIQK